MRILPLLLALLIVGCGGDSPSSPSPQPSPQPTPQPAPVPQPAPAPPPLNLSGQWGAVLAFAIDGEPFTRGALVTIIQDGTHAVGNYETSGNGQRGSLALDFSSTDQQATITGAIGVDGPSTDPNVRCAGTGRVTGTANPFTIRALVVPLVNCGGAITGLSLTMTR